MSESRERKRRRKRGEKIDAQNRSVYGRRKQNCWQLNFIDYASYLRSELWASIRRRALDRDKDTCRYCRGKATQVHHLDYEIDTLNGHTLSGLVSLCDPCHEKNHKDETTGKHTAKPVPDLSPKKRFTVKSNARKRRENHFLARQRNLSRCQENYASMPHIRPPLGQLLPVEPPGTSDTRHGPPHAITPGSSSVSPVER